MLSDAEKRAITEKPTAIMEELEQELLDMIAVELAGMENFSREEAEARQLAVALKAREIRRKYESKYLAEVKEAYRLAFTLNAINEIT